MLCHGIEAAVPFSFALFYHFYFFGTYEMVSVYIFTLGNG